MHIIRSTGEKRRCECLIEEGINHRRNKGVSRPHLLISPLKPAPLLASHRLSLVPEIS